MTAVLAVAWFRFRSCSTRSMRGGVVSGHHTVCVIRRPNHSDCVTTAHPLGPHSGIPIKEVHMSIKTDDRLDEMRRAHRPAGGERRRRPATARSSRSRVRSRRCGSTRQPPGPRAHGRGCARRTAARRRRADAKVEQLQTRLKAAEHALAAELAEDRQAFSDAMHAYLDDFKALGRAEREGQDPGRERREQADSAISDVRRSRDAVPSGSRRPVRRPASGGARQGVRRRGARGARAQGRCRDEEDQVAGTGSHDRAVAMEGPVLLCYDGSDHAGRAIRSAATLLRPRPAVVVHVRQRPFEDELAESGRRLALDAGFDPVRGRRGGLGHVATVVLRGSTRSGRVGDRGRAARPVAGTARAARQRVERPG